jgi:hypothetical protein
MHSSFTFRLYGFESISIPETLMIRCGLLATLGLLAFANPLSAQTAPGPASPPAASSPSADQPESMEDVQVGDHWTYEFRDEITGEVKSTIIHTVTEVSPTEVSIRLGSLGTNKTGYLTYDRSWNLLSSGVWRYTPNDGTGVHGPLAVGKSWAIKSNDLNSSAGVSVQRSGTAKVTAQETVTTRAGKFDTFKIEISLQTRNANDPTKKFGADEMIWYAPVVNHWVKRTHTGRFEGNVREKSTNELVEYGRR